MMKRTGKSYSIAARIHGGYLLAPNEGSVSDSQGYGRVSRTPLLVGFHGYGENADRHLASLAAIPGAHQWTLCAIRALHRFYNTKTGDVIGSWMTSLDRDQAIIDNIEYVSTVITRVREGHGPVVIAGFSQGVAMAYRAAQRSGIRCAGLIALAGDVPPDVAAHRDQPLPPILLGRGLADQWYSQAKMDADLEVLDRAGVDVETCVFEGGHEWAPEFLAAAGAFLDKIAAAEREHEPTANPRS